MVQHMVTPTNNKLLLPGPDLHCAGPLSIWRFLQYHPVKYTVGEDQKSAGPLALCHNGKSSPGYCIMRS